MVQHPPSLMKDILVKEMIYFIITQILNVSLKEPTLKALL